MARRAVLVSLGLMLVSAGMARASGWPVLGTGGPPARVSDRSFSYVAQPSRGQTTVQRLSHDRQSLTRTALSGEFIVPVVAYDGSASGLSADGRTLVLAQPRVGFPQRQTAMVVLDTHTLQPRRHIQLRGDFSVDAISPDGRWVYLIQYTDSNNPTKYRVRALDTGTGRLRAHDIVDPYDREQMQGNPLTRTTSPDGRWAYTLYDAGFIHALDTAGLTARCINLPAGVDLSAGARLRLDGTRLLVVSGGRRLAAIDASKFAPPVRASAGGIGPLPIVAIVLAVLATTALAVRRRLPGRPVPGA